MGAVAAAWYYTGGHLFDALERALDAGQCQVRIDADVLNVRSGPGTGWRVVGTYPRGATTTADPITWNGFRRLGEGRWSASRYLVPLPGARC
ncbi:SH3 domain-containing protein [Gandjariella thermophila]|uniref:SH3 domain-containing protein n=1 Tax=Gandjariella thermophila TaxID=1931992 RepID=UPI0010F7A184|nr:SH3 domain-containing protein [Gandjariella thermophila]